MTRFAGRDRHHGAPRLGHNHLGALVTRAGNPRRDGKTRQVRDDVELVDVRGPHRLYPYRLPDARRTGVEQSAGVVALLADREWVGFVAVLDPHGYLLRARPPQRAGDVGAELGVAALVGGHPPFFSPTTGGFV